jgi:hypothetical protein
MRPPEKASSVAETNLGTIIVRKSSIRQLASDMIDMELPMPPAAQRKPTALSAQPLPVSSTRFLTAAFAS